MEGLTEGRIVHYVMPNGEHRPAIVVKVWRYGEITDNIETLKAPENGCSNLQVFTDGSNDIVQNAPDGQGAASYPEFENGMFWATSVVYSEVLEPRTWHWIEKA